MTKKIVPLLLLTAFAGAMLHAKTKTVRVKTGQLHTQISAKDFKKTDALELSGTLDNSDIITLRNLCGRDSAGKDTPVLVKSLSLKNVKFQNTGAPYFLKLGKNTYSITSPYRLPACIFYGTAIEHLILPQSTDTLGTFSLNSTNLHEISVPENIVVEHAAIAYDSLLTSLELPDMADGINPTRLKIPNLKRIRYGNMNYMESGSFIDMPYLEEIIFDGMIGHIDGYMIENCPNLKRVVFNGPIFSTGGYVFAQKCPKLESIEFNGLLANFALTQNPDCPSLAGITINGPVLASEDTNVVASTPLETLKSDEHAKKQLAALTNLQISWLPKKGFQGQISRMYREQMSGFLTSLGMNVEVQAMDSVYKANRNSDVFKTKLQILKDAAPYAKYEGTEDMTVSYRTPDDSLLQRSREYFNLDSIAGNGDDISRIKNLLYWVHELVRHDGSSSWPKCRFNLIDLYKVCKEENRGLNCRFMAMMLTEALLAEGIPARYLTCLPKAYDDDSDCHVITVAWSQSLNKWIWVDPTFAAYVTDENGLLLHPGEVRERLRTGQPLVLNEDANWNHTNKQTKEDYLENYMAKNLYMIQTNKRQMSEPEGYNVRIDNKTITLVPEGFEYPNSTYLISDDKLFWLPPTNKSGK